MLLVFRSSRALVSWVGLAVLAGFSGQIQAQGLPPAAPAAQPPAANPALDTYLQRWEAEMLKIQALEARLQLIVHDKAFNSTEKKNGVAKYKKVGPLGSQVSLGLLELYQAKNPSELDKKYICTGNFTYEILPHVKEIRAYEMPKPKPGQVGNDNFLMFLFGMKAEEVKKRYDIRLAKEDDFYGYFDIYPKIAQDKTDFQKAQLVLFRQSALPRRVWFEQANGSETMWDIPQINPNANISDAEFQSPQLPQGWKAVVNPAQPVAGNQPARMPRNPGSP